jgi:hypothetical protein
MHLRTRLAQLGIHSISLLILISLHLPLTLLAGAQTMRGNYAEIPLSSLKQSLLSGDPNQLPLIALRDQFPKGKRLPSVTFDRSNPKRMVAIVRPTDKSSATAQYRVEMVPTNSMCDCQRWKVVWVGRQN